LVSLNTTNLFYSNEVGHPIGSAFWKVCLQKVCHCLELEKQKQKKQSIHMKSKGFFIYFICLALEELQS